MEDASQVEKQNFLRENILEKGYDVNQFVEFLKSKKGEAGSDISNWSMNDLYIVVKEFISINSSGPELENQNAPQTQQSSVPEETLEKRQSIPIELTDEDFGLIIPEYTECIKLETTELSKYDNIEIHVTDPKKVNKGIFSKTFINFLITTNPINSNVRRKLADFYWLRERLSIVLN